MNSPLNQAPIAIARRIHSIEPIPPRRTPGTRRLRRALGRPRRLQVTDDGGLLPTNPSTQS